MEGWKKIDKGGIIGEKMSGGCLVAIVLSLYPRAGIIMLVKGEVDG